MRCLCTTCEKPIQFDRSMLGQRTICPHCRHEVVLPDETGAIMDEADREPQLVNLSASNQYAGAQHTAQQLAQPRPLPQYSATYTGGYRAPHFVCPYCHTDMPPRTSTRISTAGWVTFGVMMFICIPLFWIGLLMTEPQRNCSGCGIRLD